ATACLPLGPSFTSNSTFWFSFRVLKPLPWISEKWAKRSSPPPSGLMKPKPFESLNHFTVPVLIAFPFVRTLEVPQGRGQRHKERKAGTGVGRRHGMTSGTGVTAHRTSSLRRGLYAVSPRGVPRV